jgi:HPt (histidine-containing phosphotransfer) domain-containing protein
VREVAHTIKGSAASFGYPELSRVAEQLQFAIDEGEMEGAAAIGERLLEALDRLLR